MMFTFCERNGTMGVHPRLSRGVGRGRMASVEGRDRTETVVLVLFWVLPLLVVAGLLAHAGLVVIAVALLAVEALVGLAVLVARRRPSRPGTPRPWLVPAVMVGVLLALVAVTLLAAGVG